MGNTKKSDTLGMPHGTASNRLRKMLLFQAIQKLGEDVCFKCSLKIQTIEDLSIEHKQPWEGISAELFWDLNNIAYSHIRCNVPATRHGGLFKRKIGPIGTAWCIGHKNFVSVDSFYKNKTKWNGLEAYCIECTGNRNRSSDNPTQRRFCASGGMADTLLSKSSAKA